MQSRNYSHWHSSNMKKKEKKQRRNTIKKQDSAQGALDNKQELLSFERQERNTDMRIPTRRDETRRLRILLVFGDIIGESLTDIRIYLILYILYCLPACQIHILLYTRKGKGKGGRINLYNPLEILIFFCLLFSSSFSCESRPESAAAVARQRSKNGTRRRKKSIFLISSALQNAADRFVNNKP